MPARTRTRATAAVACACLLAAAVVVLVVGGSDAGGSAGESPVKPPVFSSPEADGSTAAAEPEPPATSDADAPPPSTAETLPALPVSAPPAGEARPIQRSDGVQVVRSGQPGRFDAGFTLAPGSFSEAVVNVGSDGEGNTVSRILIANAVTGESVLVRTIPGAWGLPQPILDGPPQGFSYDGSRLVLQDYDDGGRFAVVSTARPDAKPLIVEPPGDVHFDSISGDGNILIVSERDGVDEAGAFHLLAVPLRGGGRARTLDDVGGGDSVLFGTPVAALRTEDASFTVYTGAGRAYVLEVSYADRAFGRFELPPSAADAGAAGAWSLAADVVGARVVAANGVLSAVYAAGDDGVVHEIALAGRADDPLPLAVESQVTAYALTDAGLERIFLTEGRARTFARPKGVQSLLATRLGVQLVGGGGEVVGVLGPGP